MFVNNKTIFPFLLLFLLPFKLLFANPSDIERINVNFYGEKIPLSFSKDMLISFQGKVGDEKLVRYYKSMEKTSFGIFLNELDKVKNNLQLNDWLYYKLMKTALNKCTAYSKIQTELISWFLLSQKGWDTRLAYNGNNVYVYVFTEDDLFEVPMIDDDNKTFVNLSEIDSKGRLKQAVYLLNFTPSPHGQTFSFYLKHLPLFQPQRETRSYVFEYKGQQHEIEVKIDKKIKELMADYPVFSEREYLEVPFSETVRNSLLPQFKVLLKDKSIFESLQILVAFTRSSFRYKRDQEYFGQSKPMIAEEVFHYPFSDCEDRSALFYSLVKELLDLPMIIIAYPDHLTIAVSFDNKKGDIIKYKGKEYFMCDPTGPINSCSIGKIPQEFKHTKFEIIGNYK